MIRLPVISKVVKVKLVYHKSILRAIVFYCNPMAMKMLLGFTKLILATLQGSVNLIINFVMTCCPNIPNFKFLLLLHDLEDLLFTNLALNLDSNGKLMLLLQTSPRM